MPRGKNPKPKRTCPEELLNQYFTVEQYAEFMNLSVGRVNNLCSENKIHYVKPYGTKLIPLWWVEKKLNENIYYTDDEIAAKVKMDILDTAEQREKRRLKKNDNPK